ncbi:MAG: serine protease, partial [Nitrososphaeraceae archaeon]|nr:serine protease [Nitrososphaeraceae archaeon]
MKTPFLFTVSILIIIVGATTAISFSIFVIPFTVMGQQQQQPLSAVSPSHNATFTLIPPMSLKTIFKQVQNSVVQIISKVPIPSTEPSNPQPQQNSTALGSGFIYDKAGRIVT